ncbi:MAG: hypothetical protein LBW85_14545 [Deltaproteobacteria bacterium]|jgi:hypothetical protein|nr:hypothetical protein [Deltaproteobacteria bacterium]
MDSLRQVNARLFRNLKELQDWLNFHDVQKTFKDQADIYAAYAATAGAIAGLAHAYMNPAIPVDVLDDWLGTPGGPIEAFKRPIPRKEG